MDIAEIVHAIKSDMELNATLTKVLDRPPIERADLIRKLAFHMKENGAPADMIEVIMQLQRTDIAEEVVRTLTGQTN